MKIAVTNSSKPVNAISKQSLKTGQIRTLNYEKSNARLVNIQAYEAVVPVVELR